MPECDFPLSVCLPLAGPRSDPGRADHRLMPQCRGAMSYRPATHLGFGRIAPR